MLPGEVLSELLVPPGVSAAPVAELLPIMPKLENTLCRQLGWLRSVFASKLGADCSLLTSPVKTKLGEAELLLVEAVELLELVDPAEVLAPAEDEGRNSIHGTATCFPPACEADDVLTEVPEVPEVPEVLEVLDGLDESAEFEPAELLFPAAELPDKEITANSRRPEAGLIIVSLMVPTSLPDDPLTWAPVSWLPRTGSCIIRPVALR